MNPGGGVWPVRMRDIIMVVLSNNKLVISLEKEEEKQPS
jgi:hypothetical protein